METVLLGRHLILLTPVSVGLSFEHFDVSVPKMCVASIWLHQNCVAVLDHSGIRNNMKLFFYLDVVASFHGR